MRAAFFASALALYIPNASLAEEAPCDLSESDLNGWFAEGVIGEWQVTHQGGVMTIMGRTTPIPPQESDTVTIYKIGDDLVIDGYQDEVVTLEFITDQRFRFEPKGEDDPLGVSDVDMSLAAGCGGDGQLPQLHYSGTYEEGGGTYHYDSYLIFGSTGVFGGIMNATFTSQHGSGTIKLSFSGLKID